MKKFLLALAAIVAFVSTSPSFAQSANDVRRYQEAFDPAYQAASHPYYTYNPYGAYGNYGMSSPYAAPDATCVQAFIISYCSSHSARPQVGQTCSDAAGHLFALDANKHWYYVEGSTGAMQVGQVVSRCPFSSYAATAAAPAPVITTTPAPTATLPNGYKFTYKNCTFTVTTDANGNQVVTRDPQ